ncbi:MAG: EAL domain-containing protein, partial [Clostridia bacterium]|nr:EAL domain-containing protein [Clostridia bacterium]
GSREILDTMEKMKSIGYSFSLDDFGTGFSNVVLLFDSHYKNVKIDKSILWDTSDKSGERTIRNLISFVRDFCSDVIQEGVETEEQLAFISSCGCDLIQGFYFSRPVNGDAFIQYLEREKSRQISTD